jgi:hypothetical protein
VPELAHRGFVWHRLAPEIDSDKLPHPRRVIQCLFYGRVREVEPLLQKVDPQHPFYAHRRSPVTRFPIMWLDQRTQLTPRHHLLHFFQKQSPSRLLRVPLETRHHRQRPLLHFLASTCWLAL